jgi:predicted PilT family ATPase
LNKYLKDLLYEQHALLPFQSVLPNTFKLVNDKIFETQQKIATFNTTQTIIPYKEQTLQPNQMITQQYPYNVIMHHNEGSITVTMLSPTTALMFIPQDQFPWYNFVGKIIGPGGKTLQKLEKNSQCKIQIRGIKSNKSVSNKQNQQPLHVQVDANTAIIDGTQHVPITTQEMKQNLDHCLHLLLPFMFPMMDENDIVKKAQLKELAKMKQQKETTTTITKTTTTCTSQQLRYNPY